MSDPTSFDPLSLDPESILAEARQTAGSEDFGDEAFRAPFFRLLRGMEEEAQLNPVGRAMQRARVVGLLVNRLRVEDSCKQFPEILAEEIRAPLVIVGLARTGTTMLQRMIAADPDVYSLLWWESRNPAPFPGTDLGAGDGKRDPRIADAEAEVEAMIEGAPDLVAMHPIEAEGPDEEIMLLEHSFYSTNPEAFVNIPDFAAWLDQQDQSSAYRYLRKLLQFLQWQKKQRGEEAKHWVLKTPHHLGFMDLLFDEFPDMHVIQTHRDPLQTIPSLASLIYAIQTLGSDTCDAKKVGRQWSARMSGALEKCMEVRAAREDRFLDIGYRELVDDPIAQIRRIYEFCAWDLTEEAVSEMQQWSVDHSRAKRDAHHYTLEQYGLTETGIRRDFAAYRTRFLDRD